MVLLLMGSGGAFAAYRLLSTTAAYDALLNQTVDAQEKLAATAAQLKDLVARFKFDDHAAPATTGPRKAAARTVTPLRRVA